MGCPSTPSLAVLLVAGLMATAGCTVGPHPSAPAEGPALDLYVESVSGTSVLDQESDFIGSPLPDVGTAGLFPAHPPEDCSVAVLQGGEESFALRMNVLRNARKSIRIQALVFKGDEAGLRIAEVLKEKKAAGLDVRVIVDALSNPWLQTQWMFFDLKQHGIEVEGYEALALQWINEIPIPFVEPHYDPSQPNKRFHEKMWIIDGETGDGVAVTGGLNIGNEYFRTDPGHPDNYWRDQDIVVRGEVVRDLVEAFDRNFDYFVGVKESRGVFNTNLYWEATRKVLDTTGKVPVTYDQDETIRANVADLEARTPRPGFRGATCRFFQNRPRLGETYIQQAYIKLIERAQREVLIANAYFVPTPSMARALKDAAMRCTSVRLISNSPETNDLPEISLVGRGHYADLLAVNETPEVRSCKDPDAGLRIWEWIGQAPDEEVRSQGTMHSKFAVFDGRRSLVGSYNLDPRSERLNSETAVVFDDEALSGELRRKFLEEDLRYAREVTPEIAARFEDPEDVIERFRQSIGYLFEDGL